VHRLVGDTDRGVRSRRVGGRASSSARRGDPRWKLVLPTTSGAHETSKGATLLARTELSGAVEEIGARVPRGAPATPQKSRLFRSFAPS
jgi:hypothetical protein